MKCPSCGFEPGGKTKRLPVREARQGCIFIANNIKCYSDTALFLLHSGMGFRRMPYIIAVLGMDEAGKVLKIIKKSIEAEGASPVETIEIENWYAHWAKGTVAGELGTLTIEWLTEILKSDPFMVRNGELKDQEFLTRYRTHLQRLKDSFSDERNSMIYIDYEEGMRTWSIPEAPKFDVVLFDVLLLSLLSTIVINHLDKGRSFLELDSVIRSIKDCKDLGNALAALDANAGTSLSEVWKALRA